MKNTTNLNEIDDDFQAQRFICSVKRLLTYIFVEVIFRQMCYLVFYSTQDKL